MTEIISAALRERADGDIHVERLLSAVHTGVRRRHRRRVLGTACAVVAALVAAGGVAVSGAREAPVRPAAAADIPRPPRMEGAPVAAFTPSSLGSDPTLFHLDVTGFDGWSSLTWSSRFGAEELRATTPEAGGTVYIEASQSRDELSGQGGEISATRVNDVPAEAVRITTANQGFATDFPRGGSAVRWEARPGIWVQVVVPAGHDLAIRMAERVRLDRTYRCAVPFRLAGLGDRAQLGRCETWFVGGDRYGGVWLNDGPREVRFLDYLEYYVAVGGPSATPVSATESIGGRKVAVVPVQSVAGATARLEYPYERGVAYFVPFFGPVDDPFLRSLVTAFQPVTDPDMTAWPRSPLW